MSLGQQISLLIDNEQERRRVLKELEVLTEWPEEYQSLLQEDHLLQEGPWAMEALNDLSPTDEWLQNILNRVKMNIGLYGDEPLGERGVFKQIVDNFHRSRPIKVYEEVSVEPQPRKAWTVLVYSNQFDNSTFAFNDMKQGERTLVEEKINIIYCMRRRDWSDEPKNPVKKWCWITRADGNWSGLRYYRVKRGNAPYYALASEVLFQRPDVDLDDTSHLAKFIRWVVPRFPADRYCLSIWNHGSHVTGNTLDGASSHNARLDKLGADLRDAWREVEPDKPISALLLNSCNLGTVEVLAEFSPIVEFAYACQTRNNTPGDGCLYTMLSNEPHVDSRELITRYFSIQSKASLHCYERNGIKTAFSATAYDLKKMGTLVEKIKELAASITENGFDSDLLADLLPADEVPFINLEFDLYELLECLSSGDEPLSVIARELLTFLAGDESPIIEHMANEHINWVHGLSILVHRPITVEKLKELKGSDEVPLPGSSYRNTRFEKLTAWLESHQIKPESAQ